MKTNNKKKDTKYYNDDKKYKYLKECSGKILCPSCYWLKDNGGYCKGCSDEYKSRCLKKICDYNCYKCSGGRHTNKHKIYTQGYCGRISTLKYQRKEEFKTILQKKMPPYFPKRITIQNRLIPVIYPQLGKYKIPQEFPEIDAWAVPVHKIFDHSGKLRKNINKNLKKILGLPTEIKLILLTYAPDDYQELLWDKTFLMDYKELGIDYWFPGHFSIYDNDSKIYQFMNAKRQQLHALNTQSQFVWFRLGENIPLKFLKPIQNSGSVLISTGQMYSKKNKKILQIEIKKADKFFPDQTAFFILGGYANLPILSKNRIIYQINSNWIMKGIRGRDLNGNIIKECTINQQKELLIYDLKEVLKNV